MIHQKPGRYWTWSWKFTCPLIMAVILISSFIDLVRTWPGYEGWNSEMAIKVELPYPWWTLILIYFLILCSLLCIPLVALLYKVGIFDPKRFGGSRYGVSKRDEMPNDDNVADSAQPLDPCWLLVDARQMRFQGKLYDRIGCLLFNLSVFILCLII